MSGLIRRTPPSELAPPNPKILKTHTSYTPHCILVGKGKVSNPTFYGSCCQGQGIISHVIRQLARISPNAAVHALTTLEEKWFQYINNNTAVEHVQKSVFADMLCAYAQQSNSEECVEILLGAIETYCLRDGGIIDEGLGLSHLDLEVFSPKYAQLNQMEVGLVLGLTEHDVSTIHRIYLNSFKRVCYDLLGKSHFPLHALFTLLGINSTRRRTLYALLLSDARFEGSIVKPASGDPTGITESRSDVNITAFNQLPQYYKIQAGHSVWCVNTRFWDVLLVKGVMDAKKNGTWRYLEVVIHRSIRNHLNNSLQSVQMGMEDLQELLTVNKSCDKSIRFDFLMSSTGDCDLEWGYYSDCLVAMAWSNGICNEQIEIDKVTDFVTGTCLKRAVWANKCWQHSKKHVMALPYIPTWWINWMRKHIKKIGKDPAVGVTETEMKQLETHLAHSHEVELKVKSKANKKMKELRAKYLVECKSMNGSCTCLKSGNLEFYGIPPKGVTYPPEPSREQTRKHKELRGWVLPNVPSDSGPIAREFLRIAKGDKDKLYRRFCKLCFYCDRINYDLQMVQCSRPTCDNYYHKDCAEKNVTQYLLCRQCAQDKQAVAEYLAQPVVRSSDPEYDPEGAPT